MFLSILSIPVFLLLCSYTPGVHGICEEAEFTCNSRYCEIRASNGTRTSYLIEKCSAEIAQTGKTYIKFHVYLTENNETITLTIAGGITRFSLFVYNTVSIEFSKTQIDFQSLVLYAYNPDGIIYLSYDFLNYFPNVTDLTIQNIIFDRFPYLNSTSLTDLNLYYLTLPNVVTILPSMLILPNLNTLSLFQSEDAQWYNVIPSSFENTRIEYLFLEGVQRFHSYQFANLTRLTYLYISRFFTNFTFEDNALSGLDGLTYIFTHYLQKNLDLVSKETFPSLIRFGLIYSTITTLEQSFFERQKELTTVTGDYIPFHCDCEMAWISHVTTNLGWSVTGTCETPSSFNGNSVSDSLNYVNCPNNQSYHCFNDTFICHPGSSCVNTADSAYCECVEGFTPSGTNNLCEDINECTDTYNCEHNCTNSIGSYSCSCLSGFTLNPPHSCEDINECTDNYNCDHNCTNSIGSYSCSCLSGFTLQSDLLTCISSGVSQLTYSLSFGIVSLLLMSLLV